MQHPKVAMKALFITAPQKWEILEVPTPEITQAEVLLRVGFVGLCGTDLELLNGKHPYFSTNNASFPMRIGHEMSGTIVQSMNPALAVGTQVIMDPIVGCGDCEGCKNRATWCQERVEKTPYQKSFKAGSEQGFSFTVPNILRLRTSNYESGALTN